MRLVIQSQEHGMFIAPMGDGNVEWVTSLDLAGLIPDLEMAMEIVADHCDLEDRAKVIDLDSIES